MKPPTTRVLFFAEGATLAHVGRPFVLADSLSRLASFEVILTRPPGYAWLTRDAKFRIVDLECQSTQIFAKRLDRGQPLFDLKTLESYVAADRALIREIRPDVVVGDFRLSLSVSARLEGVPYATICDAYWSPEAPREPPPLPVMPFTPYVPIALAEQLFSWISPLPFRLHSRPMEQLRKLHGLPGLGYDLRLAYTDADLRLFASFKALFPEIQPHNGAAFIGPLNWSPNIPLPADFPKNEKLIYISMGSSGHLGVFKALFKVLDNLGLPTVVATGGRKLPILPQSPNIQIFDFLPGNEVVARSGLMICNGGSPTSNQALLAGVPILGIPGNMDQMLNMRAVNRAGLGVSIRADRATPTRLASALGIALNLGKRNTNILRATTPHSANLDRNTLTNQFSELIGRLAKAGTP